MTNVLEVLNQMWEAFAAGPYNALPLTGGTMTGPLTAPQVTATSSLSARVVGVAAQEVLKLSVISQTTGNTRTVIKMGYSGDGYGTRIVSGGDPTVGYSGYTAFETGDGPSGYLERMRITNRGSVLVGTEADNNADLLQVAGSGGFSPVGAMGTALMRAGLSGSVETLVLRAGNGALLPTAASAMYLGKNSNTDRGISTLGTVNTLGNDYAEYIFKCLLCGLIAKGQIIGITADNTITDRWADAVMFAIKSTAPSFVGGDSWASSAGPRPEPQAGPVPIPAPRRIDVLEQLPVPDTNPPEYRDVVIPGDTDAEWAAKQAAYAAARAAYDAAAQLDADALHAFETALEAARQTVDRIAIAGRVPVNVLGAQPGDYIVPVQDGQGITGIAVHADDIKMPQYLRAVGRVISIEPDGRAYVMVKAV
ncbi:hypothetical protein [Janthinobacterium aquaticum]|uniref:hypothetical protein n=1 Tax=Janthinobacterium sp. FT58W TaxID=2654254 RepID=UPI001264712A|nr:hypothetical protein [Janthinobacterium sp. FT58W]